MTSRGLFGRWRRPSTVTDWPSAQEPATYLGVTAIEDAAVATGWDTPTGTLAVIWPCLGEQPWRRWIGPASRLADAVLLVRADAGLTGPHLDMLVDGSLGDEVEWADLSRVLGRPAPYWPTRLRDRTLMEAWYPGGRPTTSVAATEPDTAALLQLAATVAADSPMHRTLVNLAHTVQSAATNDTQGDLELVKRFDQATLVISAEPAETPETTNDDLDPSTRRAGWLDVLSRTGSLADECVRAALMWNGGADFPYSNPEIVQPDDPVAIEWLHQLVATPRTAAFVLLDPAAQGEPLVDPLTDAPAIRFPETPDGERIVASRPQRLPATSPLASVILSGHRVWVRTEDGRLWPAPTDATYGLTWGYNGTGPITLALLIDQLLDDITAPGITFGAETPPRGLHDLTRRKWPDGTTLTRAQLEAARRGPS